MRKNSLWLHLLVYQSISMIIIVVSIGFILLNSLNLQNIGYERFEEEQYFRELQGHLVATREPLREYLTDWSSSSLARLLFLMETIRDMVPQDRPVYADETALVKRNIYFLIDAYLNQLTDIIEQKRGRKVAEYTAGYEEADKLRLHLSSLIDQVSLSGFRGQLDQYRSFLDLFRRIQLQNLYLVLIATAFAYSLLLKMARNITVPMLELSRMAERISAGEFDIPDLHCNSIHDVERVAVAFNQMKNSIHDYIRKLREQKEMEQQIMNERVCNLKMEQLLKRMELYTMQAQMSPHFLFNTINTGVQLAIMEDADRTAHFMENLAALFRFNLREKKFFVPLRHEIEGLKTYYSILKIRFARTLRLELDYTEDLLDRFSCPNMILQPLVENSVLHAFKHSGNRGSIRVAICYEDPVLIISVKDNGIGIPADVVRELLTPHSRDYQSGAKVMGLENVIQRCFFLYPGQDDAIEIRSAPGQGTEIIIRLHTEVEPCIV